MLKLYHYWRSSSSWRVRWAFSLKGIACEYVAVDLLNGESESAEHLRRSPQGFVPVLEVSPGRFLTESTAIIEWAEETHPNPSLLPGDALNRARIRELAQIINSGTQPLQNLSAQFLHSEDPARRKAWAQHWIRNGLAAFDAIASGTAGKLSVGDTVTLADLCLIPQCYNAGRNDVPLDPYPTVARVFAAAMETEACKASAPERFKK